MTGVDDGRAALFQQGQIGSMTVKNRLVFPALATKLATAYGEVSEDYLAFCEARARGGVGMLIIENTTVDWHNGKGGSTLIRADSSEFIPGLNALVERVRPYGTRIGTQLQHVGRQTRTEHTFGRPPLAPSAIPPTLGASLPRALSEAEIDRVIEQFADAARRSKEAGCDFVEIHGAHGYLISQFLSPLLNKRSDRYGGVLANRMRFAVEVVRSVRAAVGPDFPVLFRVSVDEHVEGGTPFEDIAVVAVALQDAGVSAFHVSAGLYESREWIFPPAATPSGYNIDDSRRLKSHVKVPVIVVGKLDDRRVAEDVVRSGGADYVAMGRALVADPELPRKWANNCEDEVVPCIYCNDCIGRTARQWPIRCTVNPRAGRERLVGLGRPANGRRALVVGGGPAGMQAALSLAGQGYDVTVAERQLRLGGALVLAAQLPFKDRIASFLESLRWRIECDTRIRVALGVNVEVEYVRSADPDLVVVATGARVSTINGTTIADALAAPASLGRHVIIVGTGRWSAEVGEFLARTGVTVTLIEEGPDIASDLEANSRTLLLRRLAQLPVRTISDAGVTTLRQHSVDLVPGGAEVVTLKADTVLLGSSWEPDVALADALRAELAVPVVAVGDCTAPGNLYAAIQQASGVPDAIDITCRLEATRGV